MKATLPVLSSIYERAVFFDTSALEAVADPQDQYHQAAAECLAALHKANYPFNATILTVAETHRRLLYKRKLGIRPALRFLEAMYDGSTNIIGLAEEDAQQALEYVRRFKDQDLTFTDTINMAVMCRVGLRTVFSFDWHFTLLGFQKIP